MSSVNFPLYISAANLIKFIWPLCVFSKLSNGKNHTSLSSHNKYNTKTMDSIFGACWYNGYYRQTRRQNLDKYGWSSYPKQPHLILHVNLDTKWHVCALCVKLKEIEVYLNSTLASKYYFNCFNLHCHISCSVACCL
jgi:hypothetical protein